MIVTFDVETSTKNKGNPFTASGKLVSYAVKVDDRPTEFSYYTDIEFLKNLREAIPNATRIIGFNVKFDLHWARRQGLVPNSGCRIWDCQIAEFLLRGQQGSYPSLNEALARFGLEAKDDKVAEYWNLGVDTQDIPVDELKFYNVGDVDKTYLLFTKQLEVMPPKLMRLCWLMGLDLLVLADMEWNGVKLNVDLCRAKAVETEASLKEITEQLLKYSPSPRINFDSGHQLSCYLYGGVFEVDYVTHTEEMVYKSGQKKGLAYTKSFRAVEVVECPQLFIPLKGSETKLVSKVNGKEYTIYSTSEDILKQLKATTKIQKEILVLLIQRAEQAKLLDTYYNSLPTLIDKMEWEGGYLHGQFNQTVARTGRLSSSAPNMQNFSADIDLLLESRYC